MAAISADTGRTERTKLLREYVNSPTGRVDRALNPSEAHQAELLCDLEMLTASYDEEHLGAIHSRYRVTMRGRIHVANMSR